MDAPRQPRLANVHEAKTQLSRLIDAAHAGETILLAKAGKPWARLVPLESTPPRRKPGRLRSGTPLADPDVLLRPLEHEELGLWDEAVLLPPTQP